MEVTGFNLLEQKLEELINRLVTLKEDNARLRGELADKDRKINELDKLNSSLESERGQVRQRIQGLVEKLEASGIE
jgi:chromosome segregation ATPase